MKTILMIDDDLAMKEVIPLVFDTSLYTLQTETDGRVLQRLSPPLPDLILLDMQLSGIDGISLCRYLKSQEQLKNIPVILMSATPNLKRLALDSGADDTLEKPFSMKTLREMVARLLHQ